MAASAESATLSGETRQGCERPGGRARCRRPLRWWRAVGALVLLAATSSLALALTAGPAAADGPTISGVGSSYAALAIVQWDAQVASLYGDSVNYSTQSSVIGLNEFAQYPQVDFGASEIGYSSGQANQLPPSSFAYQYLPDIAGATCMDYNLSTSLGQRITNLDLDSSVLVGIFTGTITTWNNPAIAALNPGIELPNTPIIVVYRTDASGDNFIFSDYLYDTQPAAWNAYTSALQSPAGAQAIWPQAPSGAARVGQYNFQNWNGESGSDNASHYVYQNPGSITYVETGYAIDNGNPCAAVQNASGAWVKPSATADAIALQNDQLQPDLEQNLIPVFNSPQSGAYPISAYSYLIMAEQSEIPAAKQAVEAQYVEFLACRGQIAAGDLGYSPLPPNLVQDDFDAVGRITGVQPPAPTAANCPDPYITGSFGQGIAAPTVSATTTAGATSSTGGAAAANSVATTSGTSGGSAASSAARASSGASSGKAASSAAGGAASPGAAASAATGSSAASTKTTRTTQPPATPPRGQIAGVAMQNATDKLLGLPGPSGTVFLGAMGFLAVLVLPPLIASVRRRRQAQYRPHGDGDEAGP